ncbi:MAG TPA: arylsulfatase [Planctomycetota bacterium]|nr:arylsulfatase [Planctomycetota bacterium]
MMKILPVALLLLAAAAPPSFAQAPEGKPNIIFIQADDLGYGDLGCYGQKKVKTPNLDRMAREGLRFTSYYAGNTVCAPSRCALMTGFHMGHAYIRGNAELPLRAEDVTVATLLKGAGYSTAVIGKWGLGLPNNSGRPDKQGFDYSFGYLDHKHAHRQYTDHLFRNGEKVELDGKSWSNDLFTTESLDYVERNKANPFFLYLSYTNPHAELWVPRDSLDEYKGAFPEKPWVSGQGDAPGAKGYRSQETPHAAFAAMVTRMDRDIGRLFEKLKALGIDGNTLVMFTSDNGPHREGGADPDFFNSTGPLRGIKRDLTEGGIRVPMIARWPGKVAAGTTTDHVSAHWDFLPTACELAGALSPEGLDGISYVPTLVGKEQKAHGYLYWEFHERGFDQAVRRGDWKGIRNGLGEPLRVYNLKTDLHEDHDVAAQNPDVVATLEAQLKAARTESDRWVPKNAKK